MQKIRKKMHMAICFQKSVYTEKADIEKAVKWEGPLPRVFFEMEMEKKN